MEKESGCACVLPSRPDCVSVPADGKGCVCAESAGMAFSSGWYTRTTEGLTHLTMANTNTVEETSPM